MRSKFYVKGVCLGLLILSFTPFATAATINVPGDQLTIQAGIDAAVDGADEVVVDPGALQ